MASFYIYTIKKGKNITFFLVAIDKIAAQKIF